MAVRFDMVGIFVNDINKMVTFYRDVLGVSTKWDGQGPYAEFKHEGIRFSMFERSLLPNLLGCTPSYPEGMNGTFELAIDFPDTSAVDKEYHRLISFGARPVYAPREEPWGMYSSMVLDPEGNLIEIGSWKKGKRPLYHMGVVTVTVSNLEKSRNFYEELLGFKFACYYEPTNWVAYENEDSTLFAIGEMKGFVKQKSEDITDFYLEDIDALWERIKDTVTVVSKLDRTPWGSYKFVIKDPDGNQLGFVKKE
jgi:catechol 2,3-dioxygenase-like lactoylglutathione lyase family enzyme